MIFFKTTEIPAKYKELSALLLKHKQGKVQLTPEQLKIVRSRRSQYALHLRMLKTTIKHQPLVDFYEGQRLIAFAKYGTNKKAKIVATKTTIDKFKSLSSSQVRAIIKAYR